MYALSVFFYSGVSVFNSSISNIISLSISVFAFIVHCLSLFLYMPHVMEILPLSLSRIHSLDSDKLQFHPSCREM